MPKNHRMVFTATDTAAVAALQSTTGAGPLALNGTLADTRLPWVGTVRFDYFMRPVTITSANNLSGVTFTVNGQDADLNNITENIAGPNAGIVTTTNIFNRITSITVSGAVTAVSVGDGSTGTSRWCPQDVRVAKYQASCNVQVTAGTINYTVNHTFDNVLNPLYAANPQVIPCQDAGMVAATTSKYTYTYVSPVAAIQLVVNSSTAGALVFTVVEEGIAS